MSRSDDVRARGTPGTGRLGAAARAVGAFDERTGPVDAIVQVPPPELAVYPGAQLLYAAEDSAAIANGTNVVVCELEVPPGNVAVINSYIIFGVNLVVGLDATFTLEVNGGPVMGGRRRLPPQNAAAASIAWGPGEVLWRIPDGARIAVRIAVAAGGPADLGAQLGGWQYPTTIADRYGAAWRA